MIKYISYYGNNECREKRNYVLAATNKIDYIAKTLCRSFQTELLSASQSLEGFSGRYYIQTKDGVSALLFASLGYGSRIRRVLGCAFVRLQLLTELIFRTERSDTVLVYHSLGYLKTIAFAKKIRQFKLIFEVEEIYADVNGKSRERKKEIRLFKEADAFLFPTELLNETINSVGRPSVIIHGTYNVEPDRHCKLDDGRIHVVYAGTFDPRKGGATAAAAAAEFLDERYHMHIIGFGSERDKKELLDTVERASKKTRCKLTYDGLKSGEDYIRFIQSCDIGLSTQNPDAAFNNTSFPSKILSYMANGLRVVSIRIPAIEGSAIGRYMYYYDEQTPQKIANAIMAVDMRDSYDSRTIIKELDDEFAKQIEGLVNGL